MTTLIEQVISKMGIYDEPNMLSKTTELARLLELRSINIPINEYGKIIICADIAAVMLGIAFDTAIKLSHLKKAHYINRKRIIEKLLDLDKVVGVNDICIQLGLSEVSKKANELHELYKNIVAKENHDIDINHPQYAAIAVFQACKILKKKPPKTRLMPYSNLRPTQWMQLEKRWDRFIAMQYKDSIDKKMKGLHPEESKPYKQPEVSTSKSNVSVLEDYEVWKERILEMARSKLT
ncbi:origin recognition complex subunit 6-like isoform X2 [Teleopsis dalmanni]|uniref:origin recognition complex subunit 6-like isoform X2 n=1 Tax=Teleopsis dalmanni TaxID=139649 RepID=UPI0018CF3B2C|nr:origin recognition complex subunit 6-like isoform X2 [Teleopsis dalmanni]XP_037956115.1 origin recognition complex subunit 6-like isoform X2 [Teleopsis dalmanni]